MPIHDRATRHARQATRRHRAIPHLAATTLLTMSLLLSALAGSVAWAGTTTMTVTPDTGPVTGGGVVTIAGDFADYDGRYVIVDHITFDGQEYIDTGVVHINNGEGQPQVNADFQFTGMSGGQFGIVFGARAANGTTRLLFNSNSSDHRFHWQWGSATTAVGPTLPSDDRFQLSTAGATATLVDGAQSWSLTSSGTQGTEAQTIFIGGVNSGGVVEVSSMFVGNIFSFAISKGSTLRFDGVPVYDLLTGAYGLYDRVLDTFFGNASGTGTLTGPAVDYAVTVGGNACANVTLVAVDTITCVVPPSTLPGDGSGPVDVSVTRDAVPIAALADGYTYLPPPLGTLSVVKRGWLGVPAGTTYEQIIDGPPAGVTEALSGAVLPPGTSVTWTYTVTYATNTGVGLEDVTLTDSQLGPVCELAAVAPNTPTGCVGSGILAPDGA